MSWFNWTYYLFHSGPYDIGATFNQLCLRFDKIWQLYFGVPYPNLLPLSSSFIPIFSIPLSFCVVLWVISLDLVLYDLGSPLLFWLYLLLTYLSFLLSIPPKIMSALWGQGLLSVLFIIECPAPTTVPGTRKMLNKCGMLTEFPNLFPKGRNKFMFLQTFLFSDHIFIFQNCNGLFFIDSHSYFI